MEKEQDELRAAVYKGLSDAYRPPDKEIPEHIATLHDAVLEAYPDIRSDIQSGREENKGSSDSSGTGIVGNLEGPDDLEKLKTDHARLFVGPFSLLAPPYGSMYLERNEQLMTDSSINALEWYQSEGMEVAVSEVPDHIRIELEFMCFLIMNGFESENGSRDNARKKQQQFLEQHPGLWIAGFEKKICDGAETMLYKLLGQLTGRFVLRDLKELRKQNN